MKLTTMSTGIAFVAAPGDWLISSAIGRALFGACLLLAQSLAVAQISVDTAEVLMRKSGTWAQLAEISRLVKAGMAQSPMKNQLLPADIVRLERLADEAFDAKHLGARATQVLSVKIGELHSRAALRWYDSPSGQVIANVEEAATVAMIDVNAKLQEGNRILAATPDGRRTLLARVVKVTRMAEGMAAMQINTALGIVEGLAAALPNQPKPPLDQIRAQLEAQRPAMIAAMGGLSLALMADTYKTVSDHDMELYARFMASTAGSAFTNAMMEAVDQSLTNAFKTFGRGIPPARNQPTGA